MKIVREQINEIQRGDGLGVLGVGQISMCKAYNNVMKLNPSLKDKMLALDNENWVMNDGMSNFKKKMSELLEVPTSDISTIYSHDVSEDIRQYIYRIAEEENVVVEHMDIHWSGSGRTTRMDIYTNSDMGLVFSNYMHDTIRRKIFCFRTPS